MVFVMYALILLIVLTAVAAAAIKDARVATAFAKTKSD